MTTKAGVPANKSGLSDRDRKRIERTLLPLRDGANLDEILAKIGAATQGYWEDSKDEKERRSWYVSLCPRFSDASRRIAFDLECVAYCAAELLLAIDSLGVVGRNKLEDQLPRDHIPGTTSLSLAELAKQILRLHSAAQSFRLKGRRPEIVLYLYVFKLVMAYAEARGTVPRRRYNEYKQHLNKAEQHPFFAACISAAGIGKYPSRIIRQVLKDYAKPPLLKRLGDESSKFYLWTGPSNAEDFAKPPLLK